VVKLRKLSKDDFLSPVVRNGETEEVLPIEVELEDGSGTVLMTPLTMPELTDFMEKSKQGLLTAESLEFNADILSKHLVDPKISKLEMMSVGMKIGRLVMLLKTLQKVSGFFTEKPK
jgi:hypothetical protein